jgi:hypothetical protein
VAARERWVDPFEQDDAGPVADPRSAFRHPVDSGPEPGHHVLSEFRDPRRPRDVEDAVEHFVQRLGLQVHDGRRVREGADGVARQGMFEQLGVVPVALGVITATVSAMLAITWLVSFLNRHGLSPFGYYRIVVGLALLGLVASGVVTWVW